MLHKVQNTAIILFIKFLLDYCSNIQILVFFCIISHSICKWTEVQMRSIVVIFILACFNWMVRELRLSKCLILVKHLLSPSCHNLFIELHRFRTRLAFWSWLKLWIVTFSWIKAICAGMAKLIWILTIFVLDFAWDGKRASLVVLVWCFIAKLRINHLKRLIKFCCWLFGPVTSFF